MLEDQNAVSSGLLMSDMVNVGDYELLEKQNEGYYEESAQLGVESGLTSLKHATELQMRLY